MSPKKTRPTIKGEAWCNLGHWGPGGAGGMGRGELAGGGVPTAFVGGWQHTRGRQLCKVKEKYFVK